MDRSGRTRRRGAFAATAAAGLTLVAGCGVVTAEPEPQPVLIAADLELTGAGAALGAVFQDALLLRVEQVNQQRLLGDRRLELEIRDNRSDPSTSELNVAELVENPDVAAIITGGCSACAVASAEIANQRGVPMLTLAAADEVSQPVEQRRYVFKLAPNAEDGAAALATELGRARVKTIAMVAATDAYGDDGVREMTGESGAAQRAGIEVPVTARITAEEASLAAAAAEVVAYQPPPPPPDEGEAEPPDQEEPQVGPDAVVVWAPSPLAGELAAAVRAAGYQGRLFFDMVAGDELFLSGPVGEALEGSLLIFTETLVMDNVVATSPAKASRKNWFNAYSARYGTYHAFSSFAADAVQLLVEAVSRLDSTDRESIRGAFERTQLDGVTGPLRLTPDNHSALTPLALVPLVASGDRWQPAR